MCAKPATRALAIPRPPKLSAPLRVLAAPAVVLAACILQRAIFPEPSLVPFAFPTVGVALTSWLGGRGPAALATLLGAALANVFFLEPAGAPKLWGPELLATALFALGGLAIAFFAGSLWEALEEADRSADRLRSTLAESSRTEEERRRAAEALAVEHERLLAFINSFRDYVVLVDEAGKVTLANDFLRHTLGEEDVSKPARELLGMYEVLTPGGGRRRATDWPIQRALLGESATGAEWMRFTKTGAVSYLEYAVAPVRFGGRIIGAVATARDATEQRKAVDAERESEERFRIMADSAPMLIWVTDARGETLFVNQPCREFFGMGRDLRKLEWQALIHPEDAPAYTAVAEAALREHTPFRFDARFRRADGEWRWLASRAEPRFSASGQYLGHVGASPDITERKQAEVALREAERQRSEFLAMLSHELRNPLSPILSGVQVLEKNASLDERSRRALGVVGRQVGQLARLVDDLLDVTRFTRGKIRLNLARLDLLEVVRRSVEDHRSLLERHAVALDLPREPIWIQGDAARLSQAVGNLLSNAAKFTPAGGRIAVSAAAVEGDAVVEVEDTGIGMDRETLERIFQPFVQADRSVNRSQGGLGLGLALVRGLVELHGGAVRAQSAGPGQGARFTLQLPLADQTPRRGDLPAQRAQHLPGG